VQAFLDPMPIGRLWGIGRKTEPRLRALGLLTIGQLRRADPGLLREALGNRVSHFQALARGEDEREVTPERPDKSISHEVTFEVDLLSAREMLAELQRQSEAVARRLRHQHLAARTIHLKVRDHRFNTATRSLTLRAPTHGSRAVYQSAKSLLARWLKDHQNTPVRLLGVGVSGFEEQEPRLEPSRSEALDAVLDRISERFGAEAAGRGPWLTGRKR
jgi:DNA polymerase-4